MAWNPGTYNQFKAERFAPFYDLLDLIKVNNNMQVIDMGCGTGELTAKLGEALPGSEVLGVDSSAEMLQEAKQFANEHVTFQQQTIEAAVKSGKQYDLVFSNAAIQWVENHEQLLPDIISMVKKAGQMAIQLPSNHDHITHMAIRTIASTEPFKTALNGWLRIPPVLSIDAYAQILFDHGGKDIRIFEKAYPHVLQDANALVTWTSGTALLPYMERLPKELQESFMNEYRATLQKVFTATPVFYPFRRILMAAGF